MPPLLLLYLRSRRRTTTRPSGVVGTHVAATTVGHPGMRVGHSALRSGGDPRHPSRPSSRCAGNRLPSGIPSDRSNSRQPGGAGRGWPRASVAMTTERAAPWEVTETVVAPVFPVFLPFFCFLRTFVPALPVAFTCSARPGRVERRESLYCYLGPDVGSRSCVRRTTELAGSILSRTADAADHIREGGWRRRKQLVRILLERVVAPVILTWVSSLEGLEEDKKLEHRKGDCERTRTTCCSQSRRHQTAQSLCVPER